MRSLILFTVLFLLASPMAGAQTTPTQSHAEAAESLLELLKMEETLRENTDLMIRMQQEQNPMLAQFDGIMREFMEQVLDWDELRSEYVRLYTDLYSEAELRQMYDFYQTPLGQRMIETMSDLTVRSAEISQRRVEAHMPELMQRMMEQVSGGGTPGYR